MNSLSIHYRQALPIDDAELGKAAGDMFRDAYKNKMKISDLDDYIDTSFNVTQIRSELNEEGCRFYLAEEGNRIVGYAKIGFRPHHPFDGLTGFELARLYISPAYQGLRIGRNLLGQCVSYVLSVHSKLMWLAVWEKNVKAIEFYRREGFKQYGDDIFIRGNDKQRGVLMVRFF